MTEKLTPQSAQSAIPAPLSPFDAVAQAMRLASLLAGSVAQNDTNRSAEYANQLRSHLVAYMYPATPDQQPSVPAAVLPDMHALWAAAQLAQGEGIEDAVSRMAALASDARRYRWLRNRIKVREEKSMAGSYRDSIYVRVGQSFFDTPTRGDKGYVDKAHFSNECRELDAAIDAALSTPPRAEDGSPD